MQIIPATAPADLTTSFSDIVAANAVAILGVLFVGVVVTFIIRWFNKSTRRLKP